MRLEPCRGIVVAMSQPTLLSLGHGYTAQALARLLQPLGWRVIGTSRTAEGAAKVARGGAEARIWPGADLAPDLARASHLLSSVAPAGEDPVLARLAGQIEGAAAHLDWAGYLSTTAVYGDHDGGWVDETTPLTPGTRRGAERVAAENAWQSLAAQSGLKLHVFRLAGIYGPGRGPFEKVRDGSARRVIKPGQVFSRVHVEDIARVLAASITRPDPGRIYNVCDDDPAPPEDVLSFAAALLGLPDPPAVPYDQAEMTPFARSFYAESKRVRNDRIRRELGVELLYPTYREGLTALRGQVPG